MNADATLKAAMYPRCGVLVTGEDIPSGHSLRARMLVIEIKPGDVGTPKLTALQGETELLSEAMSVYVSWLSGQDKKAFAVHQRELRACATGSHARMPENAAVIQLGVETALRFAVEVGALTPDEAEKHKDQSWQALGTLAAAHDHLLKSESPAQRFLDLVSTVLSSKQAHVANTSGDCPQPPKAFGWEVVAREEEDGYEIWRGQGRCIGWVKDEILYLDPEAAFSEVQKLARSQHAAIPLTQNSLWKRLDEAGKIAVRDKEHITTKVKTAEGRKRAICLRLKDVVELSQPKADGSQLQADVVELPKVPF